MPHWNGEVETASPEFLKECRGEPVRIRDKIIAEAPLGTSVSRISFKSGEDVAIVTVEGPSAESYLREQLEAKNVVQLKSARERKDTGP